MFERFTDQSRRVIALANQQAQRSGHEFIDTEHILLGLVKDALGPGHLSVGAKVLCNLNVDLLKIRPEVEQLARNGPHRPPLFTLSKLPMALPAKKVIEFAIVEARNLKHSYVGTEHLLLGLLREHDGIGARVLMHLGVKLEAAREEILRVLGKGDLHR